MNDDKIKRAFPKTETLINAIAKTLKENNSDYFIKYHISESKAANTTAYISETTYIQVDSFIKFARYSQISSDSMEKDIMFYRFRHSYNKMDSSENIKYFLEHYDLNQFEVILKGMLFGVDSKKLYDQYSPVQVISFNTMINTKMQ